MEGRDMQEIKSRLRAYIKTRRDDMEEESWREKSETICRHISTWPIYQNARTIAAFVPFGREVDIWYLLQQIISEAKVLLLPKVDREKHELLFCRVNDLGFQLSKGFCGIREPVTPAENLANLKIDLVFVPGLAFDRSGFRLGFGRGFYDGFLKKLPENTVKVGVSFQWQVVESVPVEEHDWRVDYVVTEEGIIKVVVANDPINKNG